MRALLDWLDDRTGHREILREFLYENIPGGSRWRFVTGSALVFAFVTQVVTGLFLTMAYSPSAQTAWESVHYIQHEMQGGWLLRGVHHFMAQAMVVLLALHLLQVVIDGAYLAPREVNFWLGLVLMQLTLGLALTGYLLPWDQKGYWATSVATNLMSLVPLIGTELQQLVVGGSAYGHHTLTRFFALHAVVLPMLLVGTLLIHLALFRRHGITARKSAVRPDEYFWPQQVLKDAVASLLVLAIVVVCVLLPGYLSGNMSGGHLGAELGAPADPSEQYAAARPEWYFLFLFQVLKYFEGSWEVVGAVVIPGVVVTLMFWMPLIGRTKAGHAINVVFMLALIGGAGALTCLAVYDDYYAAFHPQPPPAAAKGEPPTRESIRYNNSRDYLLGVREARLEAERFNALVETYGGVPKEGANALGRNDPVIRGRRLFKRNCASCHPWVHGDPEGEVIIPSGDPSAPNLHRFASREWIKGLLDADRIASDEYLGKTKHAKGDMVDFVTGDFQDFKPEEVANIVKALSAEAALPYQQKEDAADSEAIAAGRKLIDDDSTGCAVCHETRDAGSVGDAPSLKGYGSLEWIVGMISDPAHERYYAKKNDRMPVFLPADDPDRGQLSIKDIELIARWLRGDTSLERPPAAEAAPSPAPGEGAPPAPPDERS
jgi:ubiquinol-cytochrome c reductase cytochrome b subunit